MDAGLLPVKSFDRAKRRLSRHLDDHERRELCEALFEDALELCGQATFVQWSVVSDDEHVLERAAAAGLGVVRDPGEGLNRAVEAGVEAAIAAGASSLTVLPVDLPLASHGDLLDLLDTGATSDVVVVPAGHDGGTNALYLAPPDAAPPRFGPSSLAAHVAAADRAGLRCAILALPSLALDIDTIDDVEALVENKRAGASRTGRLAARLRPRD